MAGDQAPAPIRRAQTVCEAVGSVQAVAPLHGVLPSALEDIGPFKTVSAPALPPPETKTRVVSKDRATQRRGPLDSVSGHKSWRYREAKTHLHHEREAVRQYRKTPQNWSCPSTFCSRRSSTGFWVDSHQAQAAAYVLISLNTVFFAFQAYFEDHLRQVESKAMDRLVYCAVEMLFILAFSVELFWRVRASPATDAAKWNQFDGAFLLTCFLDACVLNFSPSAEPVHRMVVRLMPALQVLRLGRFIQEFRLIIKGIFSAMRAVLWSLCLLALVIYVFAVLCNTCIGRASHYESDTLVGSLFGSLPSSMFTLFTFATLEDFPDAVRHFMGSGEAVGAVIAVAIIVFILFTNLSLLNLVTAVMVDTIIDILPKKHTERLAQERAEMVQRLESIFLRMDKDGNRRLTHEEFREGVDRFEEVQNELSLLQIAAPDVRELVALIDFNENGSVAVDEFINGLLRMVPTPASKKELLGMEYDMHQMWNMLGSGQEKIMRNIEELHGQLASDVEKSLKEQHDALERCVEDCCAQVEKQLKEHLDSLAQQLLAGQKQLLQATSAADSSAALARLQRSLEALPPALADERRKALDGQRRSLLEALEAKLPPPVRAADAADVSNLSRLVEELKEGQQQLLAAANNARASSTLGESATSAAVLPALRCSPSPSPSSQRTRPPPLQSTCLASTTMATSSTDAGPEPEPHSVLQTPAARGFVVPSCDASSLSSMRPMFPIALAAAPEVAPLSHGRSGLEQEPLRQRAPVPPPPMSLTQLQPPPQFQHAAMASSARAGPDTASYPTAMSCGRPPVTAQELQAMLQATLSSQAMPSAALAAGFVPQGQGQGRVALVQQWVRQNGWGGLAFDKLVLHLDRLGVELSEAEQDALQWCLRHPTMGTLL